MAEYGPYVALFALVAAGVAGLVVVGGIALAIFIKVGWILVPLAAGVWAFLPLWGTREMPRGASGSEQGGEGRGDREAARVVVRERAVNAVLITLTAWAALVLLRLL